MLLSPLGWSTGAQGLRSIHLGHPAQHLAQRRLYWLDKSRSVCVCVFANRLERQTEKSLWGRKPKWIRFPVLQIKRRKNRRTLWWCAIAIMSAQKISVPSEKSSWHYEMHFWKREKEWSNLDKQVSHWECWICVISLKINKSRYLFTWKSPEALYCENQSKFGSSLGVFILEMSNGGSVWNVNSSGGVKSFSFSIHAKNKLLSAY